MNKTAAAIKYEHYETAPWAIRSVLQVEPIDTLSVLDPCTGSGIIAAAVALRHPAKWITALDIHDWGYPNTIIQNFLTYDADLSGSTVVMNPPFSLACEFVEHALRLGAKKVICFQRLAWFESRERAAFFNFYQPDRIWLCGDRATSWRHDISPEDRKVHPETGKKRTGSTTAHAWFIFEAGSKPAVTTVDKIWKHKGEK